MVGLRPQPDGDDRLQRPAEQALIDGRVESGQDAAGDERADSFRAG